MALPCRDVPGCMPGQLWAGHKNDSFLAPLPVALLAIDFSLHCPARERSGGAKRRERRAVQTRCRVVCFFAVRNGVGSEATAQRKNTTTAHGSLPKGIGLPGCCPLLPPGLWPV